MTFEDTTQDRIQIAFCTYYHTDGSHNRKLCPVPEAYCDAIGLLVLKVQELEEKVAASQRAQVVHFVGGGEGSNGKVTYVSGGGGGGAGGAAGGVAGGGYNPGHYLGNPAKPGGY